MDELTAIKNRHSIRKYQNIPLSKEDADKLIFKIQEINQVSGLHMILKVDEPSAFKAFKKHYGSFSGCRNYIIITGEKDNDIIAGYYSEKLVLYAETLGLGTCYVGLTVDKTKINYDKNDKLYLVIVVGYKDEDGKSHKSKDIKTISDYKEDDPSWYKDGLDATLLAPTAINQQKFYFTRNGKYVKLNVKGLGFYTKIDLGIVKYHFEIGANINNFIWAN